MIEGVAAVAALPAGGVQPLNLQEISPRLDVAQPDINQIGLSRMGGDHLADGLRAQLTNLLSTEQKVHAGHGAGGNPNGVVQVIQPGSEPVGTRMIGDAQPVSDKTIQNLTSAFEYATNMALVSLVLNGMTNGITTLTSRGG